MDSVFIDDKGVQVLGLLSTNIDLGGLLYSGTVCTLFKELNGRDETGII